MIERGRQTDRQTEKEERAAIIVPSIRDFNALHSQIMNTLFRLKRIFSTATIKIFEITFEDVLNISL